MARFFVDTAQDENHVTWYVVVDRRTDTIALVYTSRAAAEGAAARL